MEQTPFELYTLSNGMHLVAGRSDGLVSYCGIYIKAGSRNEPEGKEGLAHFVEHTIFKGTDRRRGWQVASRMEDVGGELNAFTTKDHTMLYTKAPKGYDARAIELLSDIILNSRFPEQELEKEKDVVVEEIKSYLDSPVEVMYDEFDEMIFKGSGLAHPILGSPESVHALTSADCRGFLERFYTPGNMVAYCLSPEPVEKTRRLFEKYFGSLHREAPRQEKPEVPVPERFDIEQEAENHQANCILGLRTFGRTDPRRHRLYLLAHYLGGGFNSRLSRELRDKRGLVYSVYSSADLLEDTGVFAITFGCAPESVAKCRKLIRRELDKLREKPFPERTLEALKRQYMGQVIMGSDRRPSRISSLAGALAVHGRPIDIPEIESAVMSITAEELYETALTLDYDRFSALTLS